jgi:hypothetical protein
MPCSALGHFPIAGMGVCPNRHVNRFCAQDFPPARLDPPPCKIKDCAQPLDHFTDNEREMRELSLEEYNAKRQPPVAKIQDPPSIPSFATSQGGSSAVGIEQVLPSVDEDIQGVRWRALREEAARRKSAAEIRRYPKSQSEAWRKRFGIPEARERGFSKETNARRVTFRVNNDDLLATHYKHKFPSVLEINPVNRGGTLGTLQPAKFKVGYVAMVPLPIRLVDEVGADRHPLKLAQMYAAAFKNMDMAWRRLRVLFAVNLRDDYRNLKDTTSGAARFLKDYVDALNAAFVEHDLPARAIGVLWGLQVIKKNQHGVTAKARGSLINIANATLIDLSTDELREALKTLKQSSSNSGEPLKGTEFPFATFRSLLVQSTEAARMINELKEWCQNVFLHTGDGDVVTLSTVKGMSLFQAFDLYFDNYTKPIENIARLGGCTQFEESEITMLLKKYVSGIALIKSFLLTLLAKTLDSCFRGILGQTLDHCGYFAEPNTLLNAAKIDVLGLKTINNENNAEMPDWASEITKRIISGGLLDILLPDLIYQISTSARAALVVLTDDVAKVGDLECVCVQPHWCAASIIGAFTNEHNTQLKTSQVNSRLVECKIRKPFEGPVTSQLLPRRAYSQDPRFFEEDIPLTLLPGAALQAVWSDIDSEDVSTAMAEGEEIRGYLPKGEFTAANLMDLIYSFPNSVDMLPNFGLMKDMHKSLARGLKCDRYYHEDLEHDPLFEVLLQFDVVLRWAIAMTVRIMRLR